jgi:TRAP-type C4-dicarboxylate transport system permease small subunit
LNPAFVSRLSPSQQRALAVALLLLAVVAALIVLVGPIILFHRHYDVAIEETSTGSNCTGAWPRRPPTCALRST